MTTNLIEDVATFRALLARKSDALVLHMRDWLREQVAVCIIERDHWLADRYEARLIEYNREIRGRGIEVPQ